MLEISTNLLIQLCETTMPGYKVTMVRVVSLTKG